LTGLEIGPLDKPLVQNALYKVRYADAFPAEVLVERCKTNPNRDESRVVPLDYVFGARKISEVVDRTFDYVIASHVLEHLPNFFGWLRDLSSILNPGGRLFAVVPDRNFTFDIHRPLTSLGELIENDRCNVERPSFRAVFDQRFYHCHVKSAEVWRNRAKGRDPASSRTFEPRSAFEHGVRAETDYVDVHCNVFEPESFRESIAVSHQLGIQPFTCTKLERTQAPFLDFMTLLELAEKNSICQG
jgi:SAM-dependent methyltransferase